MVEVVRCDRPSGQAGPMPRPTCMEEGCTRPVHAQGRCNTCYRRWWGSPAFVPAPPPEPYAPRPDRVCPWCGPYPHRLGSTDDICPICGLDAREVAYSERIIADSDAVWREENRAFQAKRRGGP
jgi:hypothetical protein